MQPPSNPNAADEPLYEAFYGLREQPFALTTDPRFLYMSDAHRRAYEELLTGLRRREGVLLLTGDTGMGKTTLCRAVVEALGPRTFSALILNPYMSDAEILRVLLRDFGLVTRDEIRKGAFSKADMPQLLDTLEGFLRSLLALGSYAVVIIDEAQSLSAKVLDQIRVLGSYEQDGQRLLQIILVGQPSLLTTIKSDALKALDERVTRRSVLGPLPPAEVDAYIQHRLAIAGGRESVEFSAEAVNLVAETARGVPRRINLLCDRALEAGRLDGTNVITPDVVRRAAQSVDGAPLTAAPKPSRVAAAAPPPPPPPPVPTPSPSETTAAAESLDLDSLGLSLDRGMDTENGQGEIPISFGHVEDEAPRKSRFGVVFIFILVLIAGGIGAYIGLVYMNRDVTAPTLPATPIVGPNVPNPTYVPGPDDERYIMQELEKARSGRGGGGGSLN